MLSVTQETAPLNVWITFKIQCLFVGHMNITEPFCWPSISPCLCKSLVFMSTKLYILVELSSTECLPALTLSCSHCPISTKSISFKFVSKRPSFYPRNLSQYLSTSFAAVPHDATEQRTSHLHLYGGQRGPEQWHRVIGKVRQFDLV